MSVSTYVCLRVFPVVEVMLEVWLTTRQSGVSFEFLPGSQILHDQENLHPVNGRSYIRQKKKKALVLKSQSMVKFLGSPCTFDFTMMYFTDSLLQQSMNTTTTTTTESER